MDFPMLKDLPRFFAYNHWANRTLLDALHAIDGPPPRAVAALTHVYQGEHVWLMRIGHIPAAPFQPWTDASLAICDTLAPLVERHWADVLPTLTPDRLAQSVTWRPHHGADRTDTLTDAIPHMLLHSARYRGEVTGVCNAVHLHIPDVDFMHWRHGVEPR